MKHAVVAKAWVDLCYATNQQPVQKSHEFARLRTQVHLQVQLVLHHLDSQDVMMKFHKCCCCPIQQWYASVDHVHLWNFFIFCLKVSVYNVHKHHRTSPSITCISTSTSTSAQSSKPGSTHGLTCQSFCSEMEC